ncbi:endopeptidase, partial [Clostridium botulinum]|nr:endopeptidase [Clostridium botulinum]NFT44523.1 endopeptidase [Clostridium botulinum]
VKDSKGKTVMRFNKDGTVGVQDIEVINRDKYSALYRTLSNMEELWLQDVGIVKLVMKSSGFNINNGYNLDEYIDKRCYKMLEDQGLI